MTTPLPEPEACIWPVDPGCLGDEWDAYDPEVQNRSLLLASATLHRLTGYRVGGCPITVRPCKESCRSGGMLSYYDVYHGAWMTPHVGLNGMWVNSCGCTTDCGCDQLCEVALPGPVGEVIEVKVDGTPVASGDYRVDRDLLVWIGDPLSCPWPACQDLAKPDTELNTFSVTYLNSYPVGQMGAYAAGILANEFAKACIGSNKCRLPSNVTAVTRGGVSFELAAGSFPDGFTGIREIDAYIALWNPKPIRQQTQVWSPDLRSPRVMR